MTEDAIRKFLSGLAETLEQADRESVKDALAALVEVIHFDPESQHAEITYKIDVADRNKVASPRLRGVNAAIVLQKSNLQVS